MLGAVALAQEVPQREAREETRPLVLWLRSTELQVVKEEPQVTHQEACASLPRAAPTCTVLALAPEEAELQATLVTQDRTTQWAIFKEELLELRWAAFLRSEAVVEVQQVLRVTEETVVKAATEDRTQVRLRPQTAEQAAEAEEFQVGAAQVDQVVQVT